jgi:uncharacterized protein
MLSQTDIEALCRKSDIDLLVLFGSRAKGRPHSGSDVDLAVKNPRGSNVSKLDLIFELGGVFPDSEIDLVLLTEDTDPLLLHEIFSKGRPLFERRAGTFDDERLRAWKLYLDTGHLREAQASFLKRSAERSRGVA